MKFIFVDSVQVKENEDTIVIKNINNGNIVTFKGQAKNIVKALIKGEEYEKIEKQLIQDLNQDLIHCRKIVYSIIYPLINTKILKINSQFMEGDFSCNIKSCLLEITDRCNFRCPHCYVDKTDTNFLNLETIKCLAEELIQYNANYITLTGGEIFSHPQFIDIYTYLYKKGFIISLNSNASLLNEKILTCLKEMPPLILEISLYGYDETTYYEFTKTKNSFEKVLKSIECLKSNGINILLKNVITNSNKLHFSEFIKFAKEKQIVFRSDYIAFPRLGKEERLNPEQISPEEAIEYLKTKPQVKQHYLEKFLEDKFIGTKNKVFKCKIDDDSLFISSELKVCMCICMRSMTFTYRKGNLKNCIINLRKIKDMEYTHRAKCKDCKLLPICRYCPAKFFLSTSDYEIPPEWFCKFGKLVYENFILGFNCVKMLCLKQNELDRVFEITRDNMKNIGLQCGDNDKEIWQKNIKEQLNNKNTAFYLVYQNAIICGYFYLIKGQSLVLCELQICEEYKKTRTILNIIKTIFESLEFKNYNELCFNISKINKMSNKTFLHLGAELVGESEKSYKYKITRKTVEIYLNKIARKN